MALKTLTQIVQDILLTIDKTDESNHTVKTDQKPEKHESLIRQFESMYEPLSRCLSGIDKKYGVSDPEDLAAILPAFVELVNYADTRNVREYVADKLDEMLDSLQAKRQEDLDVIMNTFASDNNKIYKSAQKEGLSPYEIEERTRTYKIVGYLWGFFEGSPWEKNNLENES